MRIIWLGQAGFVLQSGGGALAVDPYCGQPPDGSVRLYDPIVPKGWKEVDIAVSTHDHWDHFDVQTYEEYVIPKAIAGPGSCMKRLRASALKDKTEAIPLDCGDTVDRCGFRLTAVYASHDRDSIGVLVECEGATLYFSGDTLFVPMLLMMNRFKPDIAFICINGKMGNMSYYEAALYCKLLEAKAAAPTHYDLIQHNTENPEAFVRTLESVAPQTKGVILKKGLEYEVSDFFAAGGALPDSTNGEAFE